MQFLCIIIISIGFCFYWPHVHTRAQYFSSYSKLSMFTYHCLCLQSDTQAALLVWIGKLKLCLLQQQECLCCCFSSISQVYYLAVIHRVTHAVRTAYDDKPTSCAASFENCTKEYDFTLNSLRSTAMKVQRFSNEISDDIAESFNNRTCLASATQNMWCGLVYKPRTTKHDCWSIHITSI